ncbi:Poly(A) polymerase pla1 [Verticillium alfalfae VaMs.102]|uniref:Poly(A) polymerase n=1 Tax=Verticillium alfalfae (strain VaMs.102 / ATCC MYA-4576 / FGSC 10136) TaxID=526221 RepID=C9SR64_VERA1|nr:Poly(A) polymerase pla1 [Verticillium alfalfae VaMs.102]EEY20866.1 Poly(A) polymerase pla1 [Verticillium alfalfae VaMs.102]
MVGQGHPLGVTPPISTALPTDAEHATNKTMLEELKQQKTFESPAETQKRHQVLEQLQTICDEFVKQVARKREEGSEALIKDARGRIFTYGSFRLGVYGPGSDIDTLVVVPKYVTRDDYFEIFPGLLQKMTPADAITDLAVVSDAFVPIIKFEFFGISIDLIFSRIASLKQLPKDPQWSLADSNLLRGLDERELRSLNGTRVTDEIINLVPEPSTFRLALRAIKLWAQRRAIYANIMGFPGGVAWAMLVARVCQLYPKATSSVIVNKFFHIMRRWPWPQPVLLKAVEEGPLQVRVWNPKLYRGDQFHLMPIITPAYPSMCATFNITKSAMTVIQRELQRGCEITDNVMLSKRPWGDLFIKHTFFTSGYKYYISVVTTSTTKEAHKIWSGYVESKVQEGSLQYLAGQETTETPNPEIVVAKTEGGLALDGLPLDGTTETGTEANGTGEGVEEEVQTWPTNVFTTTHYIGLELGEGAKSLDLSYQVDSFKQLCGQWEKYSAKLNHLTVQHVRNFNLPDDLFEPGEKKPQKQQKRAAGANGSAQTKKRGASELLPMLWQGREDMVSHGRLWRRVVVHNL